MTRQAETSSGRITSAFKTIGDKAARYIKLGAAAAVAGLTTSMVKGVKAAADYQTAMTELAKVTDPDTAGTVGAAIRQMAKDMPLSHEALMGIAADAGRLGVEGVDNILKFTDTVAKISVATDITAEEAGTDFARLLKLLGDNVDQIDELGATVNELSNNMATSSSEIVDSASRSAAALSGLGMKSSEVMALNAAMVEVSESAMRAGTALRVVAEKLKNPETMERLAEVLGITVEQFRALRDEHPVELFEVLSKAMNEGGEKAEALTGILGESASRLQALGKNWDGVEKAIELANEQYEQATSLQKEYNTASDTFNAHVQVLRNNFHDVMIDVGNKLMPTLDEFVSWLKDHTPDIGELLEKIAQGIVDTFGWVIDHKEGVTKALAAIGAGIAALGLASLLANLNPIALSIEAITAAIAALLIYWDDVVNFFKDLGRAISGWASGAWGAIKGFFGAGENAATEFADGIRAGKKEVQDAIKGLMTPEEVEKLGKLLGAGYRKGFATGITTGGASIAQGTLPGVPGLKGFSHVDDKAGLIPKSTVDKTKAQGSRLKGIFASIGKGISSVMKVTERNVDESMGKIEDTLTDTGQIISGTISDIIHDSVSGWWKQADEHKKAMQAIRDQTQENLDAEKEARDQALASLKDNLNQGFITEQEYTQRRQEILDAYAKHKAAIFEEEKKQLEEEEKNYKKNRKTIKEILEQSVRDVLHKLKEELLLKSAAAIGEAAALAIGLSPMAGPKLGEGLAYAAAATGLQFAGFEKGALFDKPTLLPAHIVAESSPEVYMPLNKATLREIGVGVAAASGVGDVNVDMRGLYDGATINVRDDQDIRKIAREIYTLYKDRMRALGRHV